MREKTLQKRHDSFWSIFKPWSNSDSFYGKSSGFTLVELLTVVGIIGILIIGALTVINPIAQFQKANDAKRKSDLSQIQKALEVYYQDNGKYPPVSSYKIVRLDGTTADWNTQFTPYMSTLPKDPKIQQTYIYFVSSNRQSYWLYASLENNTDRQFCNGPGNPNPCGSLATNGIPANACGQTCNFGVSSPNAVP